jgi:putative SOS response-associated peptidase YedK
MCGRFTFNSNLKDIERIFVISDITCGLPLSYNITPNQEVLTVIRYEDNNKLGKLHWGLVPSWAKDLSGAGKLINARSETVAEKPSFKNAFAKRRCLILADGFYEWQKTEKTKQPWYFMLPSGKPFGFAGLWEVWKSSEGQKYNSCTILTTIASESVKHVHDRMPVILRPDTVCDWLDPDTHDVGQLKEILNDGKVEKLTGYTVTNKMNSTSFNNPSCIEPLK